MIYQFDQFELDTSRFELREAGAVQPLEPQVFTLLAYLIEHRERMVPKNELFENIWDGRIVTDSALTSRVKSARQAVGDCGKAQRFIKTIYGKGFRFVADVQVAQGRGGVPPGADTDKPDIGIKTSQRPSIAVLPFRNLANASSYNTVSEGRVTELIIELARLRWLLVIAWGGMDSVRSPFEHTACVYRRCTARLNSAALTQLESVKPANQRPGDKTHGRFRLDSYG